MDVTAIILTLNEEQNLRPCLASLADFAVRCVVVDSGSTDGTARVAQEMGAEVLTHPFVNYATQFNWGLDNAGIATEWVLRMDADERMTPEAAGEIEALLNGGDPEICGITMQANFYMMGRLMRHGIPMKRKLMLFRFGAARVEERNMDEHTVLSRGKNVEIKSRFDHFDFKDIDHFVRKLNWYASREVLDVLGGGFGRGSEGVLTDERIRRTRRLKSGFYYKLPPFLRAWMLFVYCYIFRLGILDGKEGLIFAFLYTYMYRFVVDAKLYEAQKTGELRRETGPLERTR